MYFSYFLKILKLHRNDFLNYFILFIFCGDAWDETQDLWHAKQVLDH